MLGDLFWGGVARELCAGSISRPVTVHVTPPCLQLQPVVFEGCRDGLGSARNVDSVDPTQG